MREHEGCRAPVPGGVRVADIVIATVSDVVGISWKEKEMWGGRTCGGVVIVQYRGCEGENKKTQTLRILHTVTGLELLKARMFW